MSAVVAAFNISGIMSSPVDWINSEKIASSCAMRRRFALPQPSASSAILHDGLDGWSESIAPPETCYRTKYMRSELPRTTSPPIGTINNQLVRTRSTNRAGTK